MKLVFIYGPPAVGKMTVGQELAQRTGLHLLHNHMSLELVLHFFDFGTKELDSLDKKIRFAIFEEVANSSLPGLIFTLVWAFDYPEDAEYVKEIMAFFPEDTDFYFVELMTDQATRLKRNRHPHRLAHKASKRNLEQSDQSLVRFDELYKMNTSPGEGPQENVIKIDNTHLSPALVAQQIQEHFGL